MVASTKTPNLRFKNPNGQSFPTWGEVRLGDIAKKSTSSLAANSINDEIGEYPVYGASGFYKKISFYREDTPYIGIIKDGAGVGNISLYPAKSSVLSTLDVLRAKEDNVLEFIYYLMGQMNIKKYSTGSTIPHVYYRDYSQETVLIPAHKKEQRKIADFLGAVDRKVDAISQQIEKAEAFKKGLLQQMFV